MAVGKSLDWLPPGWIAEFKVRRDNRTKDWFYINSNTGQRCRSKNEVIHCTKILKLCNHTPKPSKSRMKTCSRDKNMVHVVPIEDPPDWLPTGWVMEIKTRKSGLKVGLKYKCYIAPLTGVKLYSKREVFCYLKTGKLKGSSTNMHSASEVKRRSTNKHSASKVKRRSTNKHSASEVKRRSTNKHSASTVLVEDTVEGLPPGWVKEIKIKMKENHIRKDPYYIDPLTGYAFRSKKDAFRYLESGDIGSCATKPEKRRINDMGLIDDKVSPSTAVKRQKLAGSATRRCLFSGQSSKSSNTVEDELIQEPPATEECLPPSMHAMDQCEESTVLNSLAHQEAMDLKKRQGKNVCSINKFVSVPGAEPSENGVTKHGNRKKQLGTSNSKGKKELSLPRRTSKRIAGLQAELAPDLVATDQTRGMGARESANVEANPATYIDQGAFKRLEALEAAPNVESTPHSYRGVEVQLGEEPSKEGEELVVNQATSELTEKSETEKQSNEKPESPLVLPFGDEWPDPCLEFAFKTLTGAIPVEDNLAIGNYFQQQLQNMSRTSFTLADLGLDTCQTDSHFQFSTPEKPACKQQSLVKPTFPSLGNDGLANSGENVLQQPSGEGGRRMP